MKSALCRDHLHLKPQGQDTTTTNSSCTVTASRRDILLVGALSFLGSRLAVHLAGSEWEVHAAASDLDITTEELVWYHRDQLENSGVHVMIVNFSNTSQVDHLVRKTRPVHFIYIPPGMEEDEMYYPDYVLWSKHLEEFVVLLESFRKLSPCTRVLLASRSKYPAAVSDHVAYTLVQVWMESFELALSSYHNVYNLPATVLRTSGLYGPWGSTALELQSQMERDMEIDSQSGCCWYIGDVVSAFSKALQLKTNCEVLDMGRCSFYETNGRQLSTAVPDYQYTWGVLNITDAQPLERGIKWSVSWAKSYLKERDSKSEDVIFTSYFTTTEDSQRKRKKFPNRFQYMMEWYLTVKELRMKAVVFHDGLDPGFRQRLMQHYSGISFHYLPSLQNRSTNDARFYAYLHYLESHPNIARVLLTDIADVRFQMNPFHLFDLLGDWLYIGTDIDIFPNMQTMPWLHQRLEGCFGNHSVREGDLNSLMQLDTVYNAGVIGGSRHVMMAALTRIAEYLDTAPSELNCNMPAVNYAVHKHFFQQVFTGFPLTSRFLRRQDSPKGVYIVHK